MPARLCGVRRQARHCEARAGRGGDKREGEAKLNTHQIYSHDIFKGVAP